MQFRKFFSDFMSALLVVVLVFGNLISCSGRQAEENKENITYAESVTTYEKDVTTYTEDTTTYDKDTVTRDADMVTYEEDMTAYVEDFIYYQFGEYVDDVYVVNLQNQEYIDAHIVLVDGRELDLEKIFKNVLIGAGVTIIIAIALPPVVLAMPSFAPALTAIMTGKTAVQAFAFVAIEVTKTALVTAASGAAMEAVTRYIKTEGDIDATLNGALEGASEGYKWGAIVAALGAAKSPDTFFKKAIERDIRRSIERDLTEIFSGKGVENARKMARDITNEIWNSSDDIIKTMTAEQLGAFKQYTRETIGNYAGYPRINGSLRGTLPSPLSGDEASIVEKVIQSMDSVLGKCSFPVDQTLYRGMNLSRGTITDMLKTNIFRGGNSINPDTIKNVIGKTIIEKGYSSTSVGIDVANRFANRGDGIKIILEINKTKGAHALAMNSTLSYYNEAEIVFGRGQNFKIIDAFLDENGVLRLITDLIL